MDDYISFLCSELQDVQTYFRDMNIKLCENKPLKYNKGTGKKRVIFIKKINENDLKIIWSYDNYNK